MSAPSPTRRGRGWLWLAVASGLGGAVAALAELSGADDPGPATVTLWLAVVVLALSLPVFALLVESRLEARQATVTARGEANRPRRHGDAGVRSQQHRPARPGRPATGPGTGLAGVRTLGGAASPWRRCG